jgi:hypothetical protein
LTKSHGSSTMADRILLTINGIANIEAVSVVTVLAP